MRETPWCIARYAAYALRTISRRYASSTPLVTMMPCPDAGPHTASAQPGAPLQPVVCETLGVCIMHVPGGQPAGFRHLLETRPRRGRVVYHAPPPPPLICTTLYALYALISIPWFSRCPRFNVIYRTSILALLRSTYLPPSHARLYSPPAVLPPAVSPLDVCWCTVTSHASRGYLLAAARPPPLHAPIHIRLTYWAAAPIPRTSIIAPTWASHSQSHPFPSHSSSPSSPFATVTQHPLHRPLLASHSHLFRCAPYIQIVLHIYSCFVTRLHVPLLFISRRACPPSHPFLSSVISSHLHPPSSPLLIGS
ncbi:hypothetical protein C8Q74DRAFT_18778 [Fomes fomentarius]|nr:hypothetical protein C8Q74DRAFT_18778 [Fomes fomentarius]